MKRMQKKLRLNGLKLNANLIKKYLIKLKIINEIRVAAAAPSIPYKGISIKLRPILIAAVTPKIQRKVVPTRCHMEKDMSRSSMGIYSDSLII